MAFNSQERFCSIELNGLFVDQSVLVTIGTSRGITTSKKIFNLSVVLDCRGKCWFTAQKLTALFDRYCKQMR